jgi:hypothetical protein
MICWLRGHAAHHQPVPPSQLADRLPDPRVVGIDNVGSDRIDGTDDSLHRGVEPSVLSIPSVSGLPALSRLMYRTLPY